MAIPWSIAATGWTVTVVGWLLSPIISMILNKLSAYLIFDASKELDKLEEVTVPALRETLRDVEEQRMVMRDVMSGSDLQRLDKLDTRLKSALCQAEDILDLVDYHRIEKELTGGDDGRWVQRLIQAAGASIVALGRGSWASVQRVLHASGACIAFYCIHITPAPLLQLVHSMKQKLGQFFGGWSSGVDVLPVSQATSTVGVQRLCGWCSHLVANITSCCRSVLSWSAQRIAEARDCRDWSYEQVGIKSDLQKDGNVPITVRIRLRKQIQGIEDILTSSKKSDLLNQNSSSTSKNSAKESSSKQKEIDELYRVIKQKVFGRDKDREDIIRMLREGPDTNAPSSSTVSPYSVIGIYGITGSGKTTLAQYVCDYEKDEGHFNPIMFILVGKTFSTGDIFRDMLDQITQSRPSNDGDSPKSLKTQLQKELKDKRFLLVLDDLWVNDENQTELDILFDTLSAALRGSRVLVTSQKTDAAEALRPQAQISIPDLEEGVYLSLFMHHALPDASDGDREYERIGRKIAKRLGRSPIAAVTVGKQLRRNKSISFWETTANLDVLNKIMGALWWSYQQLGVDIRRCFAYCSTFPKGYGLKRDQLVHIWIAHGFVKTTCKSTEELEDIGQSYFDQLLTFSFIQEHRTLFGKDQAFTIHDLLHELAEKVSRSEFFRIGLNGSPVDIPRGVHHLFIETKNVAEINEKILDLGNLRTLIINEDPYEKYSEKTMKTNHDLEKFLGRLFMRLTKLRVLIIELNFFPEKLSVPASIDHMKHLRYLGFNFRHGLNGLILPSTFSKLYHIQTIDIPCPRASCPEDMANLIYLRHISAWLSFPNIGRLTSLTMGSFLVKEEQGYELKQLMHLNKLRGNLRIGGLDVVGSKEEALEAHLCNKKRLRELQLWFGLDKSFGPDVKAEVLEGLCPPKDLQELVISYYNGSRYPSWVLSGHHPDAPKHLHQLLLYKCSQLAAIPEDSELFIGLRELVIKHCDWDRLPENMECLVSLQSLWIWNCDKIELLPTMPHQALETINILWCPVLSRTCKEEGHPNWDMIRHIP
ncbi:putative disease resistance protein RGA4 [Miscanthus floridulus]|uniref:putative disease resistance protein RGA4 n=1 Tax=Miscanthus floridulus TaxID=154761 RepID=UPI00345914B2